MAYEMHEWVCNEPITADKLNHMEQGIVEAQNDESSGGDVLIVKKDDEATTVDKTVYDKTWQEVYDALANGQRVIVVNSSWGESSARATQMILSDAVFDSTSGYVVSPYDVPSMQYIADSADGYLYRTGGK